MSTEIEQLKIESNLTEQFRILTYPDGTRIVAANGCVMDYSMFCCMLIWMLSGSICYITVLSKNDRLINRVKELNPDLAALHGLDGYSLTKNVFNRLGKMLTNNSKQEIMDLMSSFLQQNKLLT